MLTTQAGFHLNFSYNIELIRAQFLMLTLCNWYKKTNLSSIRVPAPLCNVWFCSLQHLFVSTRYRFFHNLAKLLHQKLGSQQWSMMSFFVMLVPCVCYIHFIRICMLFALWKWLHQKMQAVWWQKLVAMGHGEVSAPLEGIVLVPVRCLHRQ